MVARSKRELVQQAIADVLATGAYSSERRVLDMLEAFGSRYQRVKAGKLRRETFENMIHSLPESRRAGLLREFDAIEAFDYLSNIHEIGHNNYTHLLQLDTNALRHRLECAEEKFASKMSIFVAESLACTPEQAFDTRMDDILDSWIWPIRLEEGETAALNMSIMLMTDARSRWINGSLRSPLPFLSLACASIDIAAVTSKTPILKFIDGQITRDPKYNSYSQESNLFARWLAEDAKAHVGSKSPNAKREDTTAHFNKALDLAREININGYNIFDFSAMNRGPMGSFFNAILNDLSNTEIGRVEFDRKIKSTGKYIGDLNKRTNRNESLFKKRSGNTFVSELFMRQALGDFDLKHPNIREHDPEDVITELSHVRSVKSRSSTGSITPFVNLNHLRYELAAYALMGDENCFAKVEFELEAVSKGIHGRREASRQSEFIERQRRVLAKRTGKAERKQGV